MVSLEINPQATGFVVQLWFNKEVLPLVDGGEKSFHPANWQKQLRKVVGKCHSFELHALTRLSDWRGLWFVLASLQSTAASITKHHIHVQFYGPVCSAHRPNPN